MGGRFYAVLSFSAPLAEPCKKLQARLLFPPFSAVEPAVIDGVQHVEPGASKLLWLFVVSFLYIVDC